MTKFLNIVLCSLQRKCMWIRGGENSFYEIFLYVSIVILFIGITNIIVVIELKKKKRTYQFLASLKSWRKSESFVHNGPPLSTGQQFQRPHPDFLPQIADSGLQKWLHRARCWLCEPFERWRIGRTDEAPTCTHLWTQNSRYTLLESRKKFSRSRSLERWKKFCTLFIYIRISRDSMLLISCRFEHPCS